MIYKLITNQITNQLNRIQFVRNKSIEIGSKAILSKVFTKEDVKQFAKLSLDNNEIHLDKDAARRSGFDKQIVHGILINGLVSAVLGTILPGKGSILINEKINFLKPVYVDRMVTVEVEIINIMDKMNKTFYECEFNGYVNNSIDYDNKIKDNNLSNYSKDQLNDLNKILCIKGSAQLLKKHNNKNCI